MSCRRASLDAVGYTADELNLLHRRTAPAVPIAVGKENIVVNILLLIAIPCAGDHLRFGGPIVGRVIDGLLAALLVLSCEEIGEHLGPVDSPP